jgi:HEPN domain-containing protein
MAGRQSKDVRRFRVAALQRFEDAQILLDNDRATGAVYLAGYAVECLLKAVLLERTPASRRQAIWDTFRGRAGHNLDSLHYEASRVGASFPPRLWRHFLRVSSWTTDIRYHAGSKKMADARDFLESAAELMQWLERQF